MSRFSMPRRCQASLNGKGNSVMATRPEAMVARTRAWRPLRGIWKAFGDDGAEPVEGVAAVRVRGVERAAGPFVVFAVAADALLPAPRGFVGAFVVPGRRERPRRASRRDAPRDRCGAPRRCSGCGSRRRRPNPGRARRATLGRGGFRGHARFWTEPAVERDAVGAFVAQGGEDAFSDESSFRRSYGDFH